MTEDKMLALEAEGRIYSESTIPQLKRYLMNWTAKPCITSGTISPL